MRDQYALVELQSAAETFVAAMPSVHLEALLST
jgi:hypothetical protein